MSRVEPPSPPSGPQDPEWFELAAATSVVYERALEGLPFPVLVLDLPSRRIRAANQGVADIFAVPVPELIGRRNNEVVEFEDEQAMAQAVAALSDRTIEGYRAWRRITARDGVVREGDIWCRAIDLDGARYAVFILAVHEPGAAAPVLPVNPLGPLVVGTTDPDWLVERVSAEIHELCGCDWHALVGRPLLTHIHPDDIGRLLRVTESAALNQTVTCRLVHFKHSGGTWLPVGFLVTRFSDGTGSHFAFGMVSADSADTTVSSENRVADLRRRLHNIAVELRLAGVMDDAESLLAVEDHPKLNELTSRQWEILVRLHRGDRVPTIAKDLHLSQATVRNHLTTIFSVFGVHSQAELLALLRRGPGRS